MISSAFLAFGAFSRATQLSVKMLRHSHQIGLLEPVDVDRASPYRRYSIDQISTAQIIRRFRALEMPLDDIRTVMSTTDIRRRRSAGDGGAEGECESGPGQGRGSAGAGAGCGDPAVCGLSTWRVRRAGQRLRVRQLMVSSHRISVDVCQRLRSGLSVAGADRNYVRAA